MSAAPFSFRTDSPAQTRALGARLGARCRGGEVIALIGPLGAGKTQFVKGLAAGAGCSEPNEVTSPTFVLVNEYAGRLRVFHLDAYRLGGAAELEALGFEEMISPASVVVVEWADRVEAALPEGRLTVRIRPTGATSRNFTFEASEGDDAELVAGIC